MTSRKLRQILGALFFGALIGAGLMAICIIRSPHAHADGVLSDSEKAYADSGAARAVCELFDEHGVTPTVAMRVVSAVSEAGAIPMDSAVDVVNYSVQNYCPKYWSTLVAIGNEARAGVTKGPLV